VAHWAAAWAATCPKRVIDPDGQLKKPGLHAGLFRLGTFLLPVAQISYSRYWFTVQQTQMQADAYPRHVLPPMRKLEVHIMRMTLSTVVLGLLIAQGAMAAGNGDAAVGGGLGGVLGNVVGGQLGGSTGAAVGAGVGGAAGSAVGARKGSRTEAAVGGGLGAAGGSVIGNSLGGSTGSAIGAGVGGAAGGAVGSSMGDDRGSSHSGGGYYKHKHKNKYKHR
jgi:hypothetical protein